MSDIPKDGNFNAQYYDASYYAIINGKKYKKADGSEAGWGYSNPDGHWDGCLPICKTWKDIFKLTNCNSDTGLCKVLDVGSGRGTFVAFLRDLGIEAWGFDFSEFAINNPYPRCQKGWCIQHDATKTWPYGNNIFDLIIILDLMEHLYSDDIQIVIDETFRTAKKWVFLQVAVCGSGGTQGENGFKGYILKRGEKVPIEYEGVAVAGHVTIQEREWWISKLLKDEFGNERKWKLRDDLVQEFINKVDRTIIANWIKNAMIILEKIE
jgi:SAM-dependent methyltransferase